MSVCLPVLGPFSFPLSITILSAFSYCKRRKNAPIPNKGRTDKKTRGESSLSSCPLLINTFKASSCNYLIISPLLLRAACNPSIHFHSSIANRSSQSRAKRAEEEKEASQTESRKGGRNRAEREREFFANNRK